jgi:hypothetical protein
VPTVSTPGEHTFGGEDDIVAEGDKGAEQRIEDAQVQRSCVQVDAGVESLRLTVEM